MLRRAAAIGAVMAACTPFGSSGAASDGGAASTVTDGGVTDAADPGALPSGEVVCQNPTKHCSMPAEVCCIVFADRDADAPDQCIPRPADVTAACPAAYLPSPTPLTRIAECDEEADCPSGKVCCVTPDPARAGYSLLCREGSCVAPAAPACKPDGGACGVGKMCSPVFAHPYYSACH